MCVMYWEFSEWFLLYRLCFVFLCRGRRKNYEEDDVLVENGKKGNDQPR